MLLYRFRELILNNGEKELLIDFEDKSMEVISMFLETEVEPLSIYIIEAIDKVLSGASEFQQVSGNACAAQIYKEKTKIHDLWADDEDIDNWCEIETTELKEMIDIWLKKFDEFRIENPYG